MAPSRERGYLRGMSLARKAVGYAIMVAVLAVILTVGWPIARATHHVILFALAVVVNLCFMAYAGWSNWRRRS